MSKQKKLILDIINNDSRHFTAEQIFYEAKKTFPNIALGTIYNNLNALIKEKKIEKICFVGQIDRFNKVFPEHDHLICSHCGKISDILLPNLTDIIQDHLGFEIESYSLNINYVCDNCKHLKG